MKFFVPRYRHNFPHINGQILDSMFIEVDERDLPGITAKWREIDQTKIFGKIRDFFLTNVKSVCNHAVKKHVLEPYLRRPHITLHGGSKPGTADCAELFREITFETGRLVAINGFNLWTGGGRKPLMGTMTDGFHAGLKECGGPRPDQYVIHIIPAPFAFPDPGKSGPRPANEGLSRDADIVIIMPDFTPRRDLLDSRCAAAISGIGGTGTMDEFTDLLTHAKTGLRDFPFYLLNPYVAAIDKHYSHHLLEQLKVNVRCGMDLPSVFDCFKVCETPAQVFDVLIPYLEKRGQLADQAYLRYCGENGTRDSPILPGVPRKTWIFPASDIA